MKKVLAILLVLIVAMTGVMADVGGDTGDYSSGSATVTLKSDVGSVSYYGVSKTPVLSTLSGQLPSGNPWKSSVGFTSAFKKESVFYLGYVTNNPIVEATAVSVSVTPFVRDNVDLESAKTYQKVGYTISTTADSGDTINGSTFVDIKNTKAAAVSLKVSFKDVSAGGLRADEIGLTVSANAADVLAAEAGSYTATITFSVTSL